MGDVTKFRRCLSIRPLKTSSLELNNVNVIILYEFFMSVSFSGDPNLRKILFYTRIRHLETLLPCSSNFTHNMILPWNSKNPSLILAILSLHKFLSL